MDERSAPRWLGLTGAAVAALVLLPLAVNDDDNGPAGFDGYVQSGTCASPTDELVVDLETEDGAPDVEPYVAVGDDGDPVTLGYYGAPELPGLSVAVIHTDQRFSMVMTNADSDEIVACGDLLEPEDERFDESGVAVVQLLPVGSSDVEGLATLERTSLQRELDITPTRARIILSTDTVSAPDEAAAGYEGHIQSGRCDAPLDDLRVDLESEDDDADVTPFEAVSPDSADPVTVAYYGAPGAPGFGLGAAYTDEDFSMVLEHAGSGEPVACGDILEPESDEFSEAGLALVQLLPTGDAGVQGFAVLDRVVMQRELDVTPTLVRVLLFAPPAIDA